MWDRWRGLGEVYTHENGTRAVRHMIAVAPGRGSGEEGHMDQQVDRLGLRVEGKCV
jgi:hypothetical protein